MYSIDDVAKTDKDIADLIEAELARQNSHIELIASENWVSKAVMAAMGSPLTNKYAEGYPGKRLNARKNYSDVNMQMYSRTPEHRQIWRFSLQCCSREIL